MFNPRSGELDSTSRLTNELGEVLRFARALRAIQHLK